MASTLTPTQLQVLGALACGSSVTAAADAAGLHRTTVHNWSRVLPHFRVLLEDAKSSRAEAIFDKMYDLSNPAIETISEVLHDKTASTAVRLKAALAVIRSAAAPPQRPLSAGNMTADQMDAIFEDVYQVEQQAVEAAEAVENPAEEPVENATEPAPEPAIAAESSPKIHHFSSHFITNDENATPPSPLIPRSAPCPCGSRQKYKRCCGRNAPPVLGAAA